MMPKQISRSLLRSSRKPQIYLSLGALTLSGIFSVCLGAAPVPTGVILLSCNRQEAVLEVEIPALQIRSTTVNGELYHELNLPGWIRTLEEGKPSLPQTGCLIALPPGAVPELHIEVLASHTLNSLKPLPAPTLIADLTGANPQEEYREEAGVYSSATSYPSQWAKLGQPQWLRTFWVVPLSLTPLRANPAAGQIQVADKLRLRITFRGGRAGELIRDPHGEFLTRQNLLNYTAAQAWQERPSNPIRIPDQVEADYKVYVAQDGLHWITYEDLTNAKIEPINPAAINPQTFKLYQVLTEGLIDTFVQIPIKVIGEGDGEFNPNDYLLFYGQFARGTYTYENIYTRSNVYWLGWGGAPGLRLPEISATPDTNGVLFTLPYTAQTRVEVDTAYYKFGLALVGDLIDHWMWFHLDASFTSTLSYLFYLPGHVLGGNYSLSLSVRGFTADTLIFPGNDPDPDHRVNALWNNQYVLQGAAFDGQNDSIFTVPVPAGSVLEGEPYEVIVEAPEMTNFYNSFFLDWLKVDYQRKYEVVNDSLLFSHPANMGPNPLIYRLTGFEEIQSDSIELWNLSRQERLVNFLFAQDTLTFQDFSVDTTRYFVAARRCWRHPDSLVYDVPSSPIAWADTNHQADYLIITHEDFYDALSPLVTLYENHTPPLHVARIKIGDLYDEFSAGIKDPNAILEFTQLAYRYYNNPPDPPPAYILLVGDASWDYKNNDPLPYQDFLPTHSYWSFKWGETASDNYYAAVTSTILPSMFVGRFPVNTLEETQILVQKSLSYATTEPPPGYWRSQIIFTNGASIDTFDADTMDTNVELILAANFPEWYDPPRVYSNPSPGNEQYIGYSPQLIDYMNRGAISVNYQGHASNQMWLTLTQDEISLLFNGARLPFVQSYSCFTGVFSNTKGFGETMILEPDGGALSYFSNGAVGYLISNASFDQVVCQMLFNPPAPLTFPQTIGQAVTTAKVAWYSQWGGDPGDIIRTFVLLGDPAPRFAYIPPSPEDTLDNQPPEMTISAGLQGENFHNGEFIQNPVHFEVQIFDSTQVDTTTLTIRWSHLTNALGQPLDSSDTWHLYPPDSAFPGLQYAQIDSQHFALTYDLTLSGGEWHFIFNIADYFQHTTLDSLVFQIGSDKLAFDGQPLPYPSPFSDETTFTFNLTQPAEITIKIYTVAGKLIRTLHDQGVAGFNLLPWDGRDQQGDPLSNGAYLYKIIARNGEQRIERVEKVAKVQ